MATETLDTPHREIPKAQTQAIWRTFWILLGITVLEFAIAFMVPTHWHTFKVAVFVGLTIVKAFFIVSEFMHLKGEVKMLMWSILIPLLFVVWLLVALLVEGNSIFESRFFQ
ncbi:cytochrome C oxidase subunit IV family protein [Cytophagaceae bacterium DM2B3-1]|uniref:Cytochrome C oxidase subunit IV family protein n=1 Tax=Xanthocytophaga flava TaxID=3048013 RepID=A0ABT7CFJ6_9BACT|nr:cytochrome C oxidase subunit IV family protein [Xanthocytophaga flavus]MDJ1492509.1 cytochrome C oxidase subunit IV family protein [Xanthocytophaga flavus]